MKTNFIYENFLISLKDLRKIKIYFWFSFLLFLLIVFIGFFFPIFFVEKIYALLKELIVQTEGLTFFELVRFIITNNIQSSFLAIFLGILIIFPLAIIIINGYILGFVAKFSSEIEGLSILWRLFPHGVFEIPAILISVSLGLMIGISLMTSCIKYYYKKISKINLTLLIILSILFFIISFPIYILLTIIKKPLRGKIFQMLKGSLRIFILIVIPLLVIAGIIEGLLIFWLG